MEQLLVVVLCVLEHLGRIVRQVAVSATLSWLIRLVLFCAHGHHIFDSLLDHSTLNLFDAEDELKECAELFFRIGQDVLKAEEIDWLVSLLSDVNPVLEPLIIAMGAQALERLPVRKDRLIGELLLELR